MNRSRRIIPSAMVTSERSIRFQFGTSIDQETLHVIQQFCQFIQHTNDPFLEEVVPSYQTVTVFYRKNLVKSQQIIEKLLAQWACAIDDEKPLTTRTIEIPVCYEPVFSEDMMRVVNYTKLTREEIIAIHTSTLFTVYLIGFLPGFPYLGELSEALHVPRLDKPRLSVPQGSVGIGGTQTGIYPIESPGGWNIIGRTPLDLYSLHRPNPFLVRAGDQLVFHSISTEDFYQLRAQLKQNPEMTKQFVKEGLR